MSPGKVTFDTHEEWLLYNRLRVLCYKINTLRQKVEIKHCPTSYPEDALELYAEIRQEYMSLKYSSVYDTVVEKLSRYTRDSLTRMATEIEKRLRLQALY